MEYNFDRLIDRKGSNSQKHDGAQKRGKPHDLISMWIADMDFASPNCVIDAVKDKAQHGVYGYSEPHDSYFDALINWVFDRFSFRLNREWVLNTNGVVFAIATAITAFSNHGDGVMVQCPVYYPFMNVIKNNNRKLVNNPLIFNPNTQQYEINFLDFERKIIENKVKIFVLCSPHNPVGRVWSFDELKRMGEICLKHNVLVVSDEIHANIVYSDNKHSIFLQVDNRFSSNSIVCFSASKTFNLGGLQFSDIIIPNEKLRFKFANELNKCGCNHPNVFGIVAAEAAYSNGAKWVCELLAYLEGNIRLIKSFLDVNLPKLKLIMPQGTFLAWLDFRAFNMSHEDLEQRLIDVARLWLDSGLTFGNEGDGFMRLNFACPRSNLLAALEQLKFAFGSF